MPATDEIVSALVARAEAADRTARLAEAAERGRESARLYTALITAASHHLSEIDALWLMKHLDAGDPWYGPRLIGPAEVYAVRFRVPGLCPVRLLLGRSRWTGGRFRPADWAMPGPVLEELLGECLWEVEERKCVSGHRDLGHALAAAKADETIPF